MNLHDAHLLLAGAHRDQTPVRITRGQASITGMVRGLSNRTEMIETTSISEAARGEKFYTPGASALEVEIGPWWARIEVQPSDLVEVITE